MSDCQRAGRPAPGAAGDPKLVPNATGSGSLSTWHSVSLAPGAQLRKTPRPRPGPGTLKSPARRIGTPIPVPGGRIGKRGFPVSRPNRETGVPSLFPGRAKNRESPGWSDSRFPPFFWKALAYLPIENTLNGKRPRLVHRPGPSRPKIPDSRVPVTLGRPSIKSQVETQWTRNILSCRGEYHASALTGSMRLQQKKKGYMILCFPFRVQLERAV